MCLESIILFIDQVLASLRSRISALTTQRDPYPPPVIELPFLAHHHKQRLYLQHAAQGPVSGLGEAVYGCY